MRRCAFIALKFAAHGRLVGGIVDTWISHCARWNGSTQFRFNAEKVLDSRTALEHCRKIGMRTPAFAGIIVRDCCCDDDIAEAGAGASGFSSTWTCLLSTVFDTKVRIADCLQ